MRLVDSLVDFGFTIPYKELVDKDEEENEDEDDEDWEKHVRKMYREHIEGILNYYGYTTNDKMLYQLIAMRKVYGKYFRKEIIWEM